MQKLNTVSISYEFIGTHPVVKEYLGSTIIMDSTTVVTQ